MLSSSLVESDEFKHMYGSSALTGLQNSAPLRPSSLCLQTLSENTLSDNKIRILWFLAYS